MIYRCTCGVLWTTRNTTTRVDPSRASNRICPDCVGFDWPNFTKRAQYAHELLGEKKKRDVAKSK